MCNIVGAVPHTLKGRGAEFANRDVIVTPRTPITIRPTHQLKTSANQGACVPICVHMHQVRRNSMRSFMNSRIIKALAPYARAPRIFVAVALAGLSTASCDVHGISGPGSLSSIVVSPNPTTLAINGTQQFTAVGKDFSGAIVQITPVWSVVTGGGTIGSSGVFTAGTTPGTFTNTVMATSGGVSSIATVIVTPGPLATIVVTPNPVSMVTGTTQQFVAVGKDVAGNTVQLTPTWSVVAGGGTMNGTGLFTAGTAAGTFANTIQANSGSIKGTATVTETAGPLATIVVTPNPLTLNAGLNQQFTAVGKDASGNVVTITPVWSVVNGGGTIGSSGLFTAGTTLGTYINTVKATSGSISAFATVTVTATGGALATITVSPNPATLGISTAQQFTAVGRDAGGNVVDITPTWSVVAGGGTINPASGLFTAGNAPGTYTNSVRASVGGTAGFATVVVTSGSLASITVTPNPVSIQTNGTQQFTAVGNDGAGNGFSITPVWSVVNGGGSINASTGVFTAGAVAGTFSSTVKATSGTVSGFATVTVTVTAPVPSLATITVTPNPVSVQTNGTQLFNAVGRDQNGNIFLITPVWSVVNGGGTINPATGLFNAGAVAGTFTNTVTATSGAISGTATVTVTTTPSALATITVSPDPASVVANGTQQFTATGRDGNGNTFLITPVWSVVNGGGTINPATGLFTAGAVAGTFTNTVRATSGAISGTATVIVTAASPSPIVNLKTAAPNGIMAGTAFTCVSLGVINADIAISPGSTVTGFPPCVITGVQHLNDAVAVQAQIDLTSAYNTLAGLPCPAANAIVANLGGTTKPAGVYCSASSIGVSGVLTLDGGGDPNATFVFQAGSSLTTAGDVVLINGAQAKNVYWQVGSSATLGTASHFQGNILALTSISLLDNATLFGRALARNGAVSMTTGNTITLP